MWAEDRSKQPALLVRERRERSGGKPGDTTGRSDRSRSRMTTWLSTTFLKSCSAKEFTSGIRSIIYFLEVIQFLISGLIQTERILPTMTVL